jgi:hypothetical protein
MRSAIACAGIAVCVLATATGLADEQAKTSDRKDASETPLVYQPPDFGAPKKRVGGGTRSLGQLFVLSPPHPALTSLAQPRLYWYLDPGFRNALRFRLEREGQASPLLEVVLAASPDGGVQHVDLADYEIRLETGVRYKWGVILEPEPHQRWPALYSAAHLLVTPQYRADGERLDPLDGALAAARSGLWHDALNILSRQIEAQPESAQWRLLRAELLEQGGHAAVAARDRDFVQYAR